MDFSTKTQAFDFAARESAFNLFHTLKSSGAPVLDSWVDGPVPSDGKLILLGKHNASMVQVRNASGLVTISVQNMFHGGAEYVSFVDEASI